MGLKISNGRKPGSGLDFNNPIRVNQYLHQEGSTGALTIGSNTINIQIRVDIRHIARIARAMTEQGHRPMSLASIVSTAINTTLDILDESSTDTLTSFESSLDYLHSLGLSLQQYRRGRQAKRISMALQAERLEEDRLEENSLPKELLCKLAPTEVIPKTARDQIHSKEELLELDYRDRANALYSSFISKIESLPAFWTFRHNYLDHVVQAAKTKQSWAEFLALIIYLDLLYLGDPPKKTHEEILSHIQSLSLPTCLCPTKGQSEDASSTETEPKTET